MRGFRHSRWHLHEMYVKLNGEMVHLWRVVDHRGKILKSYITRPRDTEAAPLALRLIILPLYPDSKPAVHLA
jgi:transposase-like protein